MNGTDRLFILAGNFMEASNFAYRNRIPTQNFTYINDRHKLYGYHGISFVEVGGSYLRRDLADIHRLLGLIRAKALPEHGTDFSKWQQTKIKETNDAEND